MTRISSLQTGGADAKAIFPSGPAAGCQTGEPGHRARSRRQLESGESGEDLRRKLLEGVIDPARDRSVVSVVFESEREWTVRR